MPLPKKDKKFSLPTIEETIKEDTTKTVRKKESKKVLDPLIETLRETEKWKILYEKNLISKSAMRGSNAEENYKKWIDKLATIEETSTSNPNDIMKGWKGFSKKG